MQSSKEGGRERAGAGLRILATQRAWLPMSNALEILSGPPSSWEPQVGRPMGVWLLGAGPLGAGPLVGKVMCVAGLLGAWSGVGMTLGGLGSLVGVSMGGAAVGGTMVGPGRAAVPVHSHSHSSGGSNFGE